MIDLHHTWYNFINNNVENMGIKKIPSPMFLVFVFSVLQVSSVLKQEIQNSALPPDPGVMFSLEPYGVTIVSESHLSKNAQS